MYLRTESAQRNFYSELTYYFCTVLCMQNQASTLLYRQRPFTAAVVLVC